MSKVKHHPQLMSRFLRELVHPSQTIASKKNREQDSLVTYFFIIRIVMIHITV